MTLIQKTKLRQISICAYMDLSVPIPACFRIFLKPFPWNLLKIWMSNICSQLHLTIYINHWLPVLLINYVAFYCWLVYIRYTLGIRICSQTCIITIFILAFEVFQLLELMSCLVHDASVLCIIIIASRSLCVIALFLDFLKTEVESGPQEVFFIVVFINLCCLPVKLFLIFCFYSSDNKGQFNIRSIFFFSCRLCDWFGQRRFLYFLVLTRDVLHIDSLRLANTTNRLLCGERSSSFGNNTQQQEIIINGCQFFFGIS